MGSFKSDKREGREQKGSEDKGNEGKKGREERTHRCDVLERCSASLYRHRFEDLWGKHHRAESIPYERAEYRTYYKYHYFVPRYVLENEGKVD